MEQHKNVVADIKRLGRIAKIGPTIITGVSGSGKDYIVHYLKDDNIQALDKIGVKVNNRWITDLTKIDLTPRQLVVFGWSDNLTEVASALMAEYSEDAVFTLVWIQPTPELFRLANGAKAIEAAEDNSDWASDWLAKSKWSDEKVASYTRSKLELLIKKIKPDQTFIYINGLQHGQKVEHGWHRWESQSICSTTTANAEEGVRNE